jgi:hypothetical protein
LSFLAFDAMRHAATILLLPRSSHPLHHGGAIEWEELPSLADTLAERLAVLGTRHRDAVVAARSRAAVFERAAESVQAWDSTRPADFEPARASQPFHEPLEGLAIREVNEPDLFRHFFGTPRTGDTGLR